MVAEIKIELNFRNKKPISDQLQEEMRRLIQDGMLNPGDQLPTVRSLATQLRVNFNTVARAYRVLDQEGWISTQQGRGTYVLEPSPGTEQNLIPTREERIERLVNELLEKSGRMDIRPEELAEALSTRIVGKNKGESRRRRNRTGQKKRIYAPIWYHTWMQASLRSRANNRSARKIKRRRK